MHFDCTDRIRIGCETVKTELLFKELGFLVLGRMAEGGSQIEDIFHRLFASCPPL